MSSGKIESSFPRRPHGRSGPALIRSPAIDLAPMDDAPAPASRPDAAESMRPDTGDEVRLPASSLRRLSGLCGELGTGSIAALRETGREAGRELVERLPAGDGAAGMEVERFWTEIGRAAVDAGFGHPEYRVRAADVGEVRLRDSPEARSTGSGGVFARRGCHFAAGWIGGALSAAAGEPVAVLEVQCALGGDADACRFLVGEEDRLEEIRRSLRAGAGSLREAVGDR